MKTANLFQHEMQDGMGDILFNACVGENGWVNINTYIYGYQSATLVMLESVLNSIKHETNNTPAQAYFWNMDTAIYPILFSARHFIELYLKQKIHAINYFKIKDTIEDKLTKTHDIKKLWDIFIKIVQNTHDKRLNEFIELLEPYILDFAQIDLTGETFRYPYGSDNHKHLAEYSVISLRIFHEKFNELSEIFMSFTYFMDSLIDEYSVGTYTKHLNRQEIEEIAKKLPNRDNWNTDEFKQIKENIKREFQIGSKELSQTIKIIEKHIEFRRYIFPNDYLLELNKEKLLKIINKQIIEESINDFSIDEISCLRTIIELGTEICDSKYYSEDYQHLLKKFKTECEENEYWKRECFRYSLDNTQRIPQGLKILGYSEYFQAA